MKKLYISILVTVLCLTLMGCSGSNKNLTNQEIIEIFEKNGFNSTAKRNTTYEYAAGVKNGEGECFFYIESYGLVYQSISGELYIVLNSDGSVPLFEETTATNPEELIKTYKQYLKSFKLSEQQVLSALKESLNTKLKEIEDNNSKYPSYPSGTYEVGKDIPEGEYFVIAKNENSKYYLQSTDYKGNDTTTFDLAYDFYSYYTKPLNGQFMVTQDATIYPADNHPPLDAKLDGNFKVGTDIEAGVYNIVSTNMDHSYYMLYTVQATTKKNDSINIISNGLNFTSPVRVKINDGEYLKLQGCTAEKISE